VISLAVVVTGTWGTGKTSILDHRAGEVAVMVEPARIVPSAQFVRDFLADRA
jgi:predicted ATPase